ncbi:MAG: PQQ-dependent sugar dehydrogenase, partial [Planctomycetales bacterium]|nr:PQQ-dependent sugar dehydrogenase [Planctomycetales bacterium]
MPCMKPMFLLAVSLLLPLASGWLPAAEFELREGDRVVLLGDALIEQEQYAGWLEVMLTTAFEQHNVSFRNLGWSGDTPAGVSRQGLSLLQAGHEPAEEGWRQLQSQLAQTQPTLLVLGYGMSSAIEGGPAGRQAFIRDFDRLLLTAKEISPDVRFLFLSPLQPFGSQHPSASVLRLYADAIRELAQQHAAPYIDLSGVGLGDELRKDPIHLNEQGYQALAAHVAEQLRLAPAQWANSPRREALRQVILRKNVWWFHRSRPANMAYVFGFRKHEQGQNADEIPQFDDLIAREEATIARLRKLSQQPTEHLSGEEAPPQLSSQFAEFKAQPHPEFSLAEDLEVTLWAENPQLNKPIHMNFDPQGRLWVASSEAYPMIEVGQAAPDKILVLEDTTGDGRADKSTVFADGLLIPTGVVPGDGGVYVAQSTDLLFLKDSDGDGRADVKQRVLSGFGTEDTHHNLHTLLWGPDGRLYMNQSVYTRTDAETPHGIVRLKAGGGFRYDPGSMRMEVFFRGLWNAWGHQFDAQGQSFLTDGAGFQGVAYTFPGAVFHPTPGARRQLGLISPGNYPKFASLEIVSGDSYPPQWQNSLITCDFRANRVTRFSLLEQQAGFSTQQQEDLLRTSASTFRPIDVKQGPDGALYIADWS